MTEGSYWDKNKVFVAIIIILVLLFVYYYWLRGAEHLGVPFFLDQMAESSQDPLTMNYLGRERDVSGMSKHDYFLENDMDSRTGVLEQIFTEDKFSDQDGYMNLPIKYRPLKSTSASAAQLQSEIHSNDMEEWAYDDLNRTGHF